jgi:hypothetical protein
VVQILLEVEVNALTGDVGVLGGRVGDRNPTTVSCAAVARMFCRGVNAVWSSLGWFDCTDMGVRKHAKNKKCCGNLHTFY